MLRSLSDLALNISEQEYRDIPCLSYSAIKKYEKDGFSAIAHLYDQQESEALTFGSVVDTLITEGAEMFAEKYVVADFTIPTDSIKNIIDILLNNYTGDTLDEVEDETILRVCNECEYNSRLKDDTRIKKVRDEGSQYYDTMRRVGNRKIISGEMYQDALATVGALKNNPLISKYLGTTGDNIEFLYQQKFKTVLDGLEVKIMADVLMVMHDSKTIIPIDLKTSSFPEYDFPKRFLENRYDIQSRLYYRVLSDVISKDDYFKDFKINTFRFIVVNKVSRNPLVFKDEKCTMTGDIVLEFQSSRKYVLRDPITIGKELQEYLDNPRLTPIGIDNNHSNNIYERIQLL